MGITRGDLVTVTISNVKVVDTIGGSAGSFRGVHPEVQYSSRSDRASDEIFFATYGDVKVESAGGSRSRATTFDPKAGDVYRADGELWYVRKSNLTGTRYANYLVVENAAGTSYTNDPMNILDEFGAFQRKNPKLIIRNGEEVKASTSAW